MTPQKTKPSLRNPHESLRPSELKQLEQTAIQAALAGGKVLSKHFGKPLKVQEKKGAGLVTNADFEADEVILKNLKKKYSHFSFLTEESHPKPGSSEGRWIVDPLDGTTNFVHRFPMFCVSIAAEWKNELVVGVIYQPILKLLYVAVRGRGSRVNGSRICVSQCRRLSDSLLTTGFSSRKNTSLEDEIRLFSKLSKKTRAVRRPGSAAMDLAYTSQGVFDGFWEQRLKPWDIAAGILLIREAGGVVTDFHGNPAEVDCQALLAANPTLHAQLLGLTKISDD